MKNFIATIVLFISTLAYSQAVDGVGKLEGGARTITFTNPAPIVVDGTHTTTATTGNEKSDGKLHIAFKGRTGIYTYTWLKKDEPFTPTEDLNNPNTWINFSAGEYTVIASNGGCSSLPIPFTINQPDELLISLIQPNKISCFGGKTTLAINNNTATGGYPYVGTKNYTYSWYKCDDSNSSNPSLISDARTTPVTAGFYYVEVNDGKNNKKSNVVQVTQNSAISVTESPKEISCNGASDGEILLNITGGTSPYIIIWDDNSSANPRSNLVAGNYSYTIKDDNNCVYNSGNPTETNLSEPSKLEVSVTQTQPNGLANDGTITINATGGTASYQYFWSKIGDNTFTTGPTTENSISGLSNGTYRVQVIDAKNCSPTGATQIINLEALAVTINQVQSINCQIEGTASLIATASGGTLNPNSQYSYVWKKDNNVISGETNTTISNLATGSYSLEVSDSKNAMVTSNSINVTLLKIDTSNQNNVSCYGTADGTATVSVSGGTPLNGNYRFVWTNGTTTTTGNSSSISGLSAGDYSVTISDQFSCPVIKKFTITQPAFPLEIKSSVVENATGFGKSTGSISIVTAGGTPGYNYLWKNSQGNAIGTNSNIANLSAGTYSVLVTDSKNCTVTTNFTIAEPTKPVVFGTKTEAKCFGLKGSLTATANGGAPLNMLDALKTYQYTLKNNNANLELISSGNSATFTDIVAGTYSLTATDSDGIVSDAVIYEFKELSPIMLNATQTNVNCFGGNNGTISIMASGGTQNYTYIWKHDNTIIGGNSATVTNLIAGDYSIEVRDSNYSVLDQTHCVATASFTITEPNAALSISSELVKNATGFALNNGEISITVSGGSLPYHYSWKKIGDSNFISSNSDKITNLGPGNYTVLITDKNLCTVEKSFNVTEPDKLEFTIIQPAGTDILCNGNTNAKLEALVTGGVSPYTYRWFNTATASTTLSTSYKLENLGAGTYEVSVTDANQNTSYAKINTANGTNPFTINQPDSIAFTYNANAVSCTNGTDGNIQLIITGGTKSNDTNSPYIITSDGGTIDPKNRIVSGLSTGSYRIKVTDANGCKTAEQTIFISEPTNKLDITNEVSTPATGFGLATGKIEISVDGGTPIYKYVWKNSIGTIIGTNSPTLSNIVADTYTVEITDAKNCFITKTFIVVQPTKPIVSVTPLQAKCNGLLSSLQATATGGAALNQNQIDRIYTYTLKKNQATGVEQSLSGNTATFANIADGEYLLNATDSAGVISDAVVVTFTRPSAIVAIPSQTNVSCFGGTNGMVSVSVTGGTAPYTYIWKQGANTIGTNSNSMFNLSAGNYSVEIRDSNYTANNATHCVETTSFTVSQPSSALAISTFNQTDVTAFGTNNGTISITTTGGTPAYQYKWFFENTEIGETTSSISGLALGNYKVVVSDANTICNVEKTFVIKEPQALGLTVSTENVNCFGEQNGSILAIATGGMKDANGFYTYKLYDVNKNLIASQTAGEAKFEAKFAGEYYIQVVDFNSISYPSTLNTSALVVITQPSQALTMVERNKQNPTCPREADGAIVFEITGGTPNYQYSLLNLDKNTTTTPNSPSISGLIAGNYKLTVTDSKNCWQSSTFAIIEPNDFGFDKKTFTLIKPESPDVNWKMNVVIIGGQENYKYIVKNSKGEEVKNTTIPQQSLLVEQLPTDIYTVSVTDNTGCTKTEEIDLTNNVLTVSVKQTQSIICYGGGAKLEATVSGGLGIKTYTWYRNDEVIPNEDGISVSNLTPGTYKLSCKDSNKHEVISETITISQPDLVSIKNVTSINSSCFGSNDGNITINASGGSGTYLYSLDNTNWNPFTANSSSLISNLAIGNYKIYVKDSNGCNAAAFVQAEITQPLALTIANITTTNTTGFGLSNGSVSVVANGGNENYIYTWYDQNNNLINQNTNTAVNLKAGKYYVVIKDSKNCSKKSELITVSEPEKLIVTINPVNQTISCFDDRSIQLTATVSGGISNYNYEWYDVNNLLIGANAVSPFVGAGSYYLKVTDANGNLATSTSITITQPELIVVNHTAVHVNCYGEENGNVTLNAVGGSDNFEYRFKQDNTNYSNWIAFTSKNSTLHQGLKAGTYTFQVKDKNGILCSNVPNVVVTIVQPAAPLTVINSKTIVTPTTGFGLVNGSIAVEATGGNGNYAYQWFKSDGTNSAANTTAIATNLAAGKYYVKITDAKGCVFTSSLIEVTEPLLLVTSVAVQKIVLCNGDKNGSLKPTTTGGFLKILENYTYQWFADGNATPLATSTILSDIGKGSYYVIVTDSNGNKATSKSVTITEPEILNNSLAADYTLCGDANNWTITTAPTGGTPTYNYSWNTGAKTPSIQNVPPGKYSVIITDKNACSVSKEITISAPLHLAATAQINKPTCYAGNDASITLTTIGGKAPYTYLWDTGEQSSKLSNAKAGNYFVTITDAKGCIIIEKYTIENPPQDVITLGEDVTLCIDQTLTINAAINDDKATYFWQSDKGFTSTKPIVTLSQPANYTLTITNKLGCQASDTIKISSQNTPISAEFALSSQVFTNEVFTIIDISNPRPDSMEWVLPAETVVKTKNKDYAEMSFSKAGEYEITMTTKKGNCTAFQTKKVLVIEGEYKDPESTDAMKNFDLKIYPNPSNGVFTVDVTLDKVMPASIKIFSLINNSVIASKSENGKQAYLFDFSLNGLAPGVYFILFESQQGSKLRKIIIQ